MTGAGRFVCAAIICLSGIVDRAAAIADSCSVPALSDHGYDDVTFRERRYTARTRCVYKATITSADRCRTFYDVAYLLVRNDNEIEGFAEAARNQLISAMRLMQSGAWRRDPFNQSASTLRNHLDEGAIRSQYVGLWIDLSHREHNLFGPSDGPPRAFVYSDQNQSCYFDVQLQYFLKLDPPAFDHIVVIDVSPRCGSYLQYEEEFDFKGINEMTLTKWIDGFQLGREYQRLLDEQLNQLAPGIAPVELSEYLARVRKTQPYKDALARCKQFIK